MSYVVFNHTAHKALWDWLAKNPDKEKREWPGWKKNGGQFANSEFDCYACDYTEKNRTGCTKCPLTGWGGDGDSCMGEQGGNLYGQRISCSTTDLKRRSELAEKIRDLPVRPGVRCK